MKVKIDDKVYNSEEQPIMVIVNTGEKEQIANMPGTMYAQFPEGWGTKKEMEDWMHTEKKMTLRDLLEQIGISTEVYKKVKSSELDKELTIHIDMGDQHGSLPTEFVPKRIAHDGHKWVIDADSIPLSLSQNE